MSYESFISFVREVCGEKLISVKIIEWLIFSPPLSYSCQNFNFKGKQVVMSSDCIVVKGRSPTKQKLVTKQSFILRWDQLIPNIIWIILLFLQKLLSIQYVEKNSTDLPIFFTNLPMAHFILLKYASCVWKQNLKKQHTCKYHKGFIEDMVKMNKIILCTSLWCSKFLNLLIFVEISFTTFSFFLAQQEPAWSRSMYQRCSSGNLCVLETFIWQNLMTLSWRNMSNLLLSVI